MARRKGTATDQKSSNSNSADKKEPRKITAKQQKELDGMTQWSPKIRYLSAQGYVTADIARILTAQPDRKKIMRYQHVRNVLNQKLKGGDKK